MTDRNDRMRTRSATRGIVKRQLIVCAVALCIVSAGIWSLWRDMAPYHPESASAGQAAPDQVSRSSGSMTNVTD